MTEEEQKKLLEDMLMKISALIKDITHNLPVCFTKEQIELDIIEQDFWTPYALKESEEIIRKILREFVMVNEEWIIPSIMYIELRQAIKNMPRPKKLPPNKSYPAQEGKSLIYYTGADLSKVIYEFELFLNNIFIKRKYIIKYSKLNTVFHY